MSLFHVQTSRLNWRALQPGGWKAAGLLVAWLAVTCLASNDVKASCGDYLASHNAAGAPAFELTAGVDRAIEAAGFDAANDFRQDVPCRGPSCRRSPESPAPPVSPLVVQRGGEQFGLPGDAASPAVLSIARRLSGDSPLIQPVCRQRIERPPRALPVVP